MRAGSSLLRHRGVRAGVAVLAAGGVLAGVGAAGAAQDQTVLAQGEGTGSKWDKTTVDIATGDTVTWSFAGTNTHNVASTDAGPADGSGAPKDPRWEPFVYPGEFVLVQDGSSVSYTFYKSGSYNFICQVHPQMVGVVNVTGPDRDIPVATPSPTATATATPAPTATATPTEGNQNPQPTPGADDHTNTPAPSPSVDTTRPRVSSLSVRGQRRSARVRFRLTEDATVTLQIRKRGQRGVLRTVRVQANAGTRTVRVRSNKLRKGRYTVQVVARDAMGNLSTVGRTSFRINR